MEQVTRWNEPICKMMEILKPGEEKTSQSARQQVNELLQKLDVEFTAHEDEAMVKNIKKYCAGFDRGLYTCYDYPHLPRTNNALENFFRQTKAGYRRTTGLRRWTEYIVRSGELVVLTADALRTGNVLERIRSVSYEQFKECRMHGQKRKNDCKQRRRFRRNSDQYLKEIEDEFLSC